MKAEGFLARYSKLFSCRHYTQLASRDLDEELHGREKFELRFHYFICMVCRRYTRQIHLIDSAIKKYASGSGQSEPKELEAEVHLSADAKSRIQRELEAESGKN